jgi:hypothetical protein
LATELHGRFHMVTAFRWGEEYVTLQEMAPSRANTC